jgi:transposase
MTSANAAEIREAVKSSAVIQSDETSARVKGPNYCHWVFLSESGAYHQIVPQRNAKVISDLMEEMIADAWISNYFSTLMKAPARNFQICLQHQLRDLKIILERLPESAWTKQVRKLFRKAIHLNNQMICPSVADLTLRGFHRGVSEIGNHLDQLLEDHLTNYDEIRLQNRFRLHREKLLTFMDYPGVPPTNNASEQAIRTSVIHRKVTNGFRSEWGAKAYADLLSAISTSKIGGKRVFETLVNLMGSEVPPFLHA